VADISDDPELEKGRQSGCNCSGFLVSNVLTGLGCIVNRLELCCS